MKTDIFIKIKEKYQKNIRKYKDFLVLDDKKVINDKDKIIKPKEIKIERTIIQRFLAQKFSIETFPFAV